MKPRGDRLPAAPGRRPREDHVRPVALPGGAATHDEGAGAREAVGAVRVQQQVVLEGAEERHGLARGRARGRGRGRLAIALGLGLGFRVRVRVRLRLRRLGLALEERLSPGLAGYGSGWVHHVEHDAE